MEELPSDKKEHVEVTLRPNGPLVIRGDFEVQDESGNVLKKLPQMSFCRCRLSRNLPFCDGTHKALY